MTKYKIRVIGLLFISFLITSCSNSNSNNLGQTKDVDASAPSAVGAVSSEMRSSPLDNTVVVYYFHGNFRCASCHRIEQYTKEAVESYFGDELSSGKVVFMPVNVEERGNEHFVKDYQLYTKSVVLSLVKNGDEVRFSNLEKVWNLLGSKDKFLFYVKAEVEKYLGDL